MEMATQRILLIIAQNNATKINYRIGKIDNI